MHNKALLLTMDDQKQVVAKIPYPIAGLPHLTTASEVATMEYMRDFVDTPVPKVYAWSSNADETPVGAEYIIMEKASGVALKSVWRDLGIHERFAVTKEIIKHQETWSSVAYQAYGSI